MAKRKNTIQRKEKHVVHGNLEICRTHAYEYAKELEEQEIDYKVNQYFFHDGITQKGYKVIPFDNVSLVRVFKISGSNDIQDSEKHVKVKNRPMHEAFTKEINKNVKNNFFINNIISKFTNLLKIFKKWKEN